MKHHGIEQSWLDWFVKTGIEPRHTCDMVNDDSGNYVICCDGKEMARADCWNALGFVNAANKRGTCGWWTCYAG